MRKNDINLPKELEQPIPKQSIPITSFSNQPPSSSWTSLLFLPNHTLSLIHPGPLRCPLLDHASRRDQQTLRTVPDPREVQTGDGLRVTPAPAVTVAELSHDLPRPNGVQRQVVAVQGIGGRGGRQVHLRVVGEAEAVAVGGEMIGDGEGEVGVGGGSGSGSCRSIAEGLMMISSQRDICGRRWFGEAKIVYGCPPAQAVDESEVVIAA